MERQRLLAEPGDAEIPAGIMGRAGEPGRPGRGFQRPVLPSVGKQRPVAEILDRRRSPLRTDALVSDGNVDVLEKCACRLGAPVANRKVDAFGSQVHHLFGGVDMDNDIRERGCEARQPRHQPTLREGPRG
jgi:hypothetical protein